MSSRFFNAFKELFDDVSIQNAEPVSGSSIFDRPKSGRLISAGSYSCIPTRSCFLLTTFKEDQYPSSKKSDIKKITLFLLATFNK